MIPLLNLKKQAKVYKKDIIKGIKNNIDSGEFVLGKNINILERKLSYLTNSKYCVTCSSGTDALLMSLMSLDIKENDIIFTTVYSYISTAEVIKFLKAIPIFIDINPKTLNIDYEKLSFSIQNLKKRKFLKSFPKQIKKLKKLHLKGIISVSLFGNPFDYEKIKNLAKQNKLFLIEDAAQSFGAKIKNNYSGALGDIGCLSFYPTKSLSCYGDGGAILTNNKRIYKKLLSIRVHGKAVEPGEFERIGLTGRLDTIQATVLLEKIKLFKKEMYERNRIARIYKNAFSKVGEINFQEIKKNHKSAYSVFIIILKSLKIKKIIIKNLKKNHINFGVYYKKPFHLQKVFSDYKIPCKSFPVAEKISKLSIAIPIDPYLSNKEINKIIEVINEK